MESDMFQIARAVAFGLGLALAGVGSAQAVTTFTLNGEVVGGPFDGTLGTGFFSYDESALTNIGSEFLTPGDGLIVEFTLFGQTFSTSDDIDFNAFPELEFFDGQIFSLAFLVSEVPTFGGANTRPINQTGVQAFELFDLFDNGAGGFDAPITVTAVAVPLPASLPLMLAALGALGFAARRRAA